MNERQFEDVINQWTNELLMLNGDGHTSLAETLLITRLGLLGQKLIYEANAIGMRDTARTIKEANDAHTN